MPEVVTTADRIRRHARTRHIEPARQAGRGTVSLRVGDVARRRSGLWNNNHVDEDYASSFLDILERRIELT